MTSHEIRSKARAPRGKNERIYFDAEARDILVSLVVSSGIPKSNVVCAMIRLAGGGSPRPGEEVVYAILKRAIGRDQFLAFLGAVKDALPSSAEPIHDSLEKPGRVPDQWRIKNSGVFAFFAPSDENAGDIFARSSLMKAAHGLSRVIVVTTSASQISKPIRSDLEKAGVSVVSLADFAATIKRLAKTGKCRNIDLDFADAP